MTRFAVTPDEKGGLQSFPALSPDGRTLVYALRPEEGPVALWAHSFESGTSRRLAGTEGAQQPFWSPDGKRLAFFAGGQLKRFDLATGLAQSLAAATDPRGGAINFYYAYATPNPPPSMRLVGTGAGAYPLDHAFYVSPPGRFPDGASKSGVEDAAGNVLPWVADGPHKFIWTHSWEKHKGDLAVGTWDHDGAADGYYAIGIRCAQD